MPLAVLLGVAVELVSMLALVMATARVDMDKVAMDRVASGKEATVSALWAQVLCYCGHLLQDGVGSLTCGFYYSHAHYNQWAHFY